MSSSVVALPSADAAGGGASVASVTPPADPELGDPTACAHEEEEEDAEGVVEDEEEEGKDGGVADDDGPDDWAPAVPGCAPEVGATDGVAVTTFAVGPVCGPPLTAAAAAGRGLPSSPTTTTLASPACFVLMW